MNANLIVKKVEKTAKLGIEMDPLLVTKCQNASFECSLPTEENQQYCIKHILQDSLAPYKQCTFIHVNGKQCTQAKLIEEKNDSNYSPFCFEHSRLSQINKTKSTVGCFKQIETPETLISSLAHHVKLDKVKPQSTTKITPFDDEDEIDVVSLPSVDPFTDIVAVDINNRGKNILDFASESSSDEDTPTTMMNTWRCHELDNSDDESVDSTEEDVLKHAGIYTVDEVVTITKEKMQRLQSLYIDQFQRLQYVLREKRRNYLIELKKEKEALCSIHDQPKDSPKERKLYNNLKAMNRYHRRYGVEALLQKQFREKRQKHLEPSLMAAPGVPLQKNIPKCTFSEGGVKCNERSIPCCKFCRKHILEDKKQILFKACSIEKSGVVCQEPVVNIFDDSSCVLHTELPQPKTYIKRKYESETEEDEDAEPQIKKEAIEQLVEMDITTSDLTNDDFVIVGNHTEVKVETKIEPTSTDDVVVVA